MEDGGIAKERGGKWKGTRNNKYRQYGDTTQNGRDERRGRFGDRLELGLEGAEKVRESEASRSWFRAEEEKGTGRAKGGDGGRTGEGSVESKTEGMKSSSPLPVDG